MRLPVHFSRWLCVLAACLAPAIATAAKQTVCTITINSADEKQTLRRHLPSDKYDFVELVERNRPDWLASSCEAKVSCDVLVVSGHHSAEDNVFFSDSLEKHEFLPIEELERVTCSDSCPDLFANLKEVYLFGCDTLNPQPLHAITGEISRGLVREGRSPAQAAQLAKLLGQQRGESSRDRMRLVFRDVPVIYGFSSAAPLGPVAASSLNRYLQHAGSREIGKGRTSNALIRQFSSHGMVSARGIAQGDPLTPLRRDVCTFADDRLTDAQRVAAIHELLRRSTTESRLLLERFERFTASLDPQKRHQPDFAQGLERIAHDTQTRDRYMAFARDADEPRTRARMVQVAHQLGWLSADDRRNELAGMLGDVLARKEIAPGDVNLACTVNKDRDLDGALDRLVPRAARLESTGHSAVLACAGSADARTRVLQALVSPADADVQLAQAYLRHRPIADANELRVVTRAVASMHAPEAQTRALDALGRHYLSDRESVETLKQLFASTRSAPVQNAIAGVLIRADRKTIRRDELLRTLREYRLKPSPRDNMVDALIERLEQSS